MAQPDELEFRCPKCGHPHRDDVNRARCFTITCGLCMTPMRKTGRKKVEGELVEPEPPVLVPTMIPQPKVIDKK